MTNKELQRVLAGLPDDLEVYSYDEEYGDNPIGSATIENEKQLGYSGRTLPGEFLRLNIVNNWS